MSWPPKSVVFEVYEDGVFMRGHLDAIRAAIYRDTLQAARPDASLQVVRCTTRRECVEMPRATVPPPGAEAHG